MPRASTVEEDELNDGGFIARSGKPLPEFSQPLPSVHSSLLGNRNRKRKGGGKDVVLPQSAGTQPKNRASGMVGEVRTVDISNREPLSDSTNNTLDCATASRKQMVTLTGTIKRGHKQDELVRVQFEIPEDELKRLNSKRSPEEHDRSWGCGLSQGLHVLVFTLLFTPLAFVGSLFTTFYIGTLCWYNFYLYFSEELTIWHKIFCCPLLLVTYPVLITVSTFCLSVVGAVRQVSWRLSRWCRELRDFDKGFFVWVCNVLSVPQCAPYEVVILDETPVAADDSSVRQCGTSEHDVQTQL